MTPALQGIAVLLLGSTAVRLVATDDHLRFVKPSLGPWLLAAGAALVALGLAVTSRALAPGAVAHAGPRVGLLLLLPVAVVYVVAPPALGSYAAERTGVREPAPVESLEVPLPDKGPDGYRETTLSDYTSRAYWDVTPSYEGEPVVLTGFVTPREDGGWWLTRMQIACCAADGAPLKVLVRDAPAPPRDTWVRVEGVGVGDPAQEVLDDDGLGEVVAERVVPVQAPENPYE